MIRVLYIGPEEEARASAIIAYAKAHPYYPKDSVPPGFEPRHVLEWASGYKAVFSFTRTGLWLWRHLSVSVPGPKSPHPEAVKKIAFLFGFTQEPLGPGGFPISWGIMPNQAEQCIVVVEKMEASL